MFIGLVWLVALFWPVCFRRKSFDTGLQVQRILVCQSVFSAIQAGLGISSCSGKAVLILQSRGYPEENLTNSFHESAY